MGSISQVFQLVRESKIPLAGRSNFSQKEKKSLFSEAKDFHGYTKGTNEAKSDFLNFLIKVNTRRHLTTLGLFMLRLFKSQPDEVINLSNC